MALRSGHERMVRRYSGRGKGALRDGAAGRLGKSAAGANPRAVSPCHLGIGSVKMAYRKTGCSSAW